MESVLSYKGYRASVRYVVESQTLRGLVLGINDYIDFECSSAQDVEHEFHDAIDDYLEFCKEIGKNPDKEYKGVFNVRINPNLHRQLALEAEKNSKTINRMVEKAIDAYLNGNQHSKMNWTGSNHYDGNSAYKRVDNAVYFSKAKERASM